MNVYIAHLIGDYILQNDWIASRKKKSSLVCLLHVMLYLIPFLFSSLPWWKLGLIGLQHFIQDRTNIVVWFIKFKGGQQFCLPPMAPWSIIVTDNVIHVVFIALMVWL